MVLKPLPLMIDSREPALPHELLSLHVGGESSSSTNAYPFGKYAPARRAIREHEAPPDPLLRALDDCLPSTAVASLFVCRVTSATNADTLAILLPHKSKNLPTWGLDG